VIYAIAGITGALAGIVGTLAFPEHPILAGIIGGLLGAWFGAYVTR
jgi:hypothetical protein